MRTLDAVDLGLTLAAAVTGALRWLRVAQREHYLAGSTLRFACRWWRSGADNEVLFVLGLASLVTTVFFAPTALIVGSVTLVAPRRLSVRGRTSRLAWTRRLTTLTAATALLAGACVAVGAVVSGLRGAAFAAAVVALGSPVLVDAALFLTGPLEDLLASRYVRRARERLAEVRPIVVAVTGSYGKTTVKGYVAHLAGPYRTTLPSPKSYNNRAGLTRTVNEMLAPGTEVLVAEMGTYGPGEIAALCRWLRPEISVITAIGPAHLERFRSLDRTLTSKAEITETAHTVVLNADDERLAGLAEHLQQIGKKVLRASAEDRAADVAVLSVEEGLELRVAGSPVGMVSVPIAARPTSLSNAACASAVALELGVRREDLLARLATLPVPTNRLQRYSAGGGYVVFDDTFNSNPSGARLALGRLAAEESVSSSGRRVVVTPGMVELGPLQHEENRSFGVAAAAVADVVIFVARTNRSALLQGARESRGNAAVVTVDRLDEALEWVRHSLGPGDAVLYENDLPDHFP